MGKNSRMKFWKKRVAVLLAVAMALTLFAGTNITTLTAYATPNTAPTLDINTGSVYLREDSGRLQYMNPENGEWMDYEGTFTITGSSTTNKIIVETGSHKIKLKDVNIDVSGGKGCAFDIQNGAGDVTVLLEGTNTLKSGGMHAGIEKNSTDDKNLTITSAAGDGKTDGSLETGTVNGAGIGGAAGGGTGKGGNGSNITINGGTVKATGYSAGIGGGNGIFDKGGDGSNITINGGTVTAISTGNGAGIGGAGFSMYSAGDGSGITINGGTVTAISNGDGAGIGGGAGAGTCEGGNGSDITINGGTVTATSTGNGAGIGGGAGEAIKGGDGSDITIKGGTVTATSNGNGAGIGGGEGFGHDTYGGKGNNITIKGGTVTATSMYGIAGIGGGKGTGGNGSQTGNKITATDAYKANAWKGENESTATQFLTDKTSEHTIQDGDIAKYMKIVMEAATYAVTVNKGTGDGSYEVGKTITITADAALGGQVFEKWTVVSGGVTLASATSASTTFTMPANAVEVTATYKDKSTAPAPTPSYRITDGAKSTWAKGSDATLTFRGDGAFEDFVSVKVDGKVIGKENYTAKAGSTVITLKTSYLNALTAGEHTLEMVWKDGSVSTTFTMKGAAGAPETGDTGNISTWLTLMMGSACAIAGIYLGRRKKNDVNESHS